MHHAYKVAPPERTRTRTSAITTGGLVCCLLIDIMWISERRHAIQSSTKGEVAHKKDPLSPEWKWFQPSRALLFMHGLEAPGLSSGNWVVENANASCIHSLVRDTWTATQQLMELPDAEMPGRSYRLISEPASLQNYPTKLR